MDTAMFANEMCIQISRIFWNLSPSYNWTSHVCFVALLFSSFITAPFVLRQVLKGLRGQNIYHLCAAVLDFLHLGKLCIPVKG